LYRERFKKHFPDGCFFYRREISSTQKKITGFLKQKDKITLLIAAQQTDGIGRYERKWFSPEGGLWFSIYFPFLLPENFPLLFARNLKQAFKKKFGITVQVKKPNDLVYRGRKLAGFLLTRNFSKSFDFSILGIGINVNNEVNFDGINAISIREILGKNLKLEDVFDEVLKTIVKTIK